LAVFDGDYATAAVAVAPHDPLEACGHAFRENFVHDPWLVRCLARLLGEADFEAAPLRSHGYVESPQGAYLLSWVERGADALANASLARTPRWVDLLARGRLPGRAAAVADELGVPRG
jgi:hypothetical protein